MASSEASTELSATAAERDRQAQAYFGRDNYELYEQGSAKVIALRAAAASAAQPARSRAAHGSSSSKRYCFECKVNVSGFARHNAEMHVRDPAHTIFCPVGDCDVSIIRVGTLTNAIDDHLANHHQDFRNDGGRGGDLLENSTKASVLMYLNVKAALFVLSEDHLKAEGILGEIDRLVEQFQKRGLRVPPALKRTFPADLAPDCPTVNPEEMKHVELVAYIIKVRKELQIWYDIFIEAEELLLESKA